MTSPYASDIKLYEIKKSSINMKKTLLLLSAMIMTFLITGCSLGTQDIGEIKQDSYVGEQVSVYGNVSASLKLGGLSGFVITDENGNSIRVSSASIPGEGTQIRVSGTLMSDSLWGYYIKRDE